MGHGITMGLPYICFTHINTEVFRLQYISKLLQNLLMFSLYIALHLSYKALFNLCHFPPFCTLLKPDTYCTRKTGMWCISPLVSWHIARQNMTRNLLPASWIPLETWRWCRVVWHPVTFSSQSTGGFETMIFFWAYDLHHHHSQILKFILFSEDSF